MKNVQDIYPVSPMQEFMLLHGLGGAQSDTLFNQFVFSVASGLDPNAFSVAWDQVIASHPALRTAFVWQGVDTPQQVVRQTVKAICDVHDFQAHDHETQASKFEELLEEDRALGFDFRRAPLMRFKLVQLAAEEWRVVWSSHHLILDRWCIDGLINQFQRQYRNALTGGAENLVRAPSYRDYIAWIQRQDTRSALKHWTDYLDGFSQPITVFDLTHSAAASESERVPAAKLALGAPLTQKIRALSRDTSVTMSCIVQAALGAALGVTANKADVVFGVTVAGRPADIHNVEDIIGSFINTLPVRVRLDPERQKDQWLRELNAAQFANSGKDYLSQAQLRTCASIGSQDALFDILLVWLSQTTLEGDESTVEAEGFSQSSTLPLVPASEQYATAYPLTVSVLESQTELVLRADAARGQALPLVELLDLVSDCLVKIVDASATAALHEIVNIDTIEHHQPLQASVKGSLSLDAFEASMSAGVAKVKGREDARVDVIEDLLRGEWKHALESDRTIEPSDDFFKLGGDSLKAASMHVRIESATRKAIPMLALFERPTLQGMTQTLLNEKWPLRAGIAMPLRVSSNRSPVFCVASPEVNTLGYAMLTRHLSEHVNVVVLQAPPSSEDLLQMHPNDLERVATNYLAALRDIQPKGPYSLLSMCSGAHIALTMARQLERDGEEVGFLGVINTWSLYSISWRFYLNRFLNIADYYAKRVGNMASAKLNALRAAEEPLTSAASGAVQSPQGSRPLKVLVADSEVGMGNPWIRQVGFAHLMPKDLHTRVSVTVFRLADQPFWRIGERELGWKRLTGGALAIDIPGNDHDSILREPEVDAVASAIEAELNSSFAQPNGNKS